MFCVSFVVILQLSVSHFGYFASLCGAFLSLYLFVVICFASLFVVIFQLFVVVLCLFCSFLCLFVPLSCGYVVSLLSFVFIWSFCFPLCGLSVSFQVFLISAWLFCVYLWSLCILCGHASLCALMDSHQEMSTAAPKTPACAR